MNNEYKWGFVITASNEDDSRVVAGIEKTLPSAMHYAHHEIAVLARDGYKVDQVDIRPHSSEGPSWIEDEYIVRGTFKYHGDRDS